MIGVSVGPYRVLQPLGAGGMGEVFLAEDARLRRRVALKRLTGGDAGEGRARILREARAVAQLHHPGISSIFDVFEDADTVWIVMEYIEGETLSQRLGRGPVPLAEALDLGLQIADALANAHAHGILHCDLKPLNIRLTPAGRTKILDFGLARRSADAVESETTEMVSMGIGRTGPGDMAGTAGYLAPERLAGTVPDARGDIYSVGVILFQLLVGRRPFDGTDIVSTAVTALTTPTPSPSAIDQNIPRAVSAIVIKALHREPNERFQSAAQLAAAIRAAIGSSDSRGVRSRVSRRAWWLSLAAIAVAAAVGAPFLLGRHPPPSHPAAAAAAVAATSIAVRPFTNAGGRASDDYLGSGFTDELIAKLSLFPQATVVSRQTTAAYLAARPTSSSLPRDLGAAHVVGGSVSRDGDRLHVTAEIVAATGAREWTAAFDGTMSGLFALQQQVAEHVAEQLRLSQADRQRLDAVPTRNIGAFADYSQGRLFLDRKDVKGNVDHAIDAFDRAIKKDPGFALAHAGLGSAYWERYVQTTESAWTLRAIDASLEAQRLEPGRAEVLVTLATIYNGMGRTKAAVDELHRALALQPNGDEAHRILGNIFAGQRRIDDAVREFQQAIALRPNYWSYHNDLAAALMSVGRYAEAESSVRRVIELQPDSHVGFANLGAVAMMRGDLDTARDSFERAAVIRPSAGIFSNLGTLQFWNGHYEEARKSYMRAIAMSGADAGRLHRNLGDALAELHQTGPARKAYATALGYATQRLKVNPNDAPALGLMALAEAKLGNKADARMHADKALALAPKSPDMYYRVAAVAAIAGERDAALAALNTALDLGYSAEFARRDLDLRSLRALPAFTAGLDRKR